jgi:hypothetical protein
MVPLKGGYMRFLITFIARVLACVMGWFRTTNAETSTREDVSPQLTCGHAACVFCGEEMSEEDKRLMGYVAQPDEREPHEVPEEELLERIPTRDPVERAEYYPCCQGCTQRWENEAKYEDHWDRVEDDGHSYESLQKPAEDKPRSDTGKMRRSNKRKDHRH